MQLFLDMDGVLADFDKRAREILGEEPQVFEDKYGSALFWATLQDTEDFYNSFDKMPDADDLYEAVKHLNPTILTGVPKGDWARPQKLVWCARMFPGVPVITCASRYKSVWMNAGDIIVDDRTEYRHLWQNKNGVWVHHTDTPSTLRTLRHIGIIP